MCPAPRFQQVTRWEAHENKPRFELKEHSLSKRKKEKSNQLRKGSTTNHMKVTRTPFNLGTIAAVVLCTTMCNSAVNAALPTNGLQLWLRADVGVTTNASG